MTVEQIANQIKADFAQLLAQRLEPGMLPPDPKAPVFSSLIDAVAGAIVGAVIK